MTSVAARTGELFNYANIAGEVGVSEPTIKNWISILERTGIVYILQPYSSSALVRAVKAPKIYFRDTGLACWLTRWLSPETLMNSAVAGNMFETFVVLEILKSYSNEGQDYRFSIFYYRGRDKKASGENEIDLVIEEDGILYPIEIKRGIGKDKADKNFNILEQYKMPIETGLIIDTSDKVFPLNRNTYYCLIEE